jgi:hypothetical protein
MEAGGCDGVMMMRRLPAACLPVFFLGRVWVSRRDGPHLVGTGWMHYSHAVARYSFCIVLPVELCKTLLRICPLPADSVRARKSVLAATAAYCHANVEHVSRYPWERLVAARRTVDRGRWC